MPTFPNVVILFNKEAFEVVGQLNERIQKSGIRWNMEQNFQTSNTIFYVECACVMHDVACGLRAHERCAYTIRANVYFVIVIS